MDKILHLQTIAHGQCLERITPRLGRLGKIGVDRNGSVTSLLGNHFPRTSVHFLLKIPLQIEIPLGNGKRCRTILKCGTPEETRLLLILFGERTFDFCHIYVGTRNYRIVRPSVTKESNVNKNRTPVKIYRSIS